MHTNAFYTRGTNVITVNNLPGDINETLTHETLHYLAALNGGHIIKYDNVQKEIPRWLHEGLTELFAQAISRAHGVVNHTVNYPEGTAFGAELSGIIGVDALFDAYKTGDFNNIKRLVDAQLGKGTFERLINKENGTEAFLGLSEAMKKVNLIGRKTDVISDTFADIKF